jgi:hypothetical protein
MLVNPSLCCVAAIDNCITMKRLISVSIPRSGHHLLVQLLWNYFKHGQFLYCEAYTYRECCGHIPCDAVSRRAQSAFGDGSQLRLFMQKSHDLDFEVPIDAAARYIVQLRDPSQAAIGLLRWEMTHGSRENFSLGEIQNKVFDFFCYYIRFYHKWCVPVVVGANTPDTRVIHYETLICSRAQTRGALLQLLEWLNLPIDDSRLEYSLDSSLTIDSHTNETRSHEMEIRDVDYYDRLCGGSFIFLLDKVAAFCPGLPLARCGAEARTIAERVEEQMGELFFPLDLSSTANAVLDFRRSERQLKQHSLAVDAGYPSVCRALGLSYGEKGSGVWTIGDNAIFPFRISASAQSLRGEIVVVATEGQIALSQILSLSAVLQGIFAPVRTSFWTRGGRTTLAFDFSAPRSASSGRRDAALVLTIARPKRSSKGTNHTMNLLLDSLSLSSEPDREFAMPS